MSLHRRMIFFFACSVFFLFFPQKAQALKEFDTSLQSKYRIDQAGVAQVEQTIRIKNVFSTVYIKQYAFEVSSNTLEDVVVSDPQGNVLNAQVTTTDAKTSIGLTFPDKVIGKDAERVIFVRYVQRDITLASGSVLEVDVPKLAEESLFDHYAAIVEVPAVHGAPSYSSPQTAQVEQGDGITRLLFGETARKGITLLFGEQQTYAFTLKYHLSNPSVSPGVSQIALPPDTAFQKIQYDSITPLPDSIQLDDDGNWIATYTVDPQNELTITASGHVQVQLQPRNDFPKIGKAKLDKRYLGEQPYWEVRDSSIQKLALTLTSPKAVYEEVVQRLQYDYSKLNNLSQERMGARKTLSNPDQAICREFTDLFVTLARAAGIPAREVNGFAITNNARMRPLGLVNDLLHAWPEYFDKERGIWVPVDPTWEDTTGGVDFFSKLDFNHVVFVIHGMSSEKPYPAGVYKIPGKEEKDVQVAASAPLQIPPLLVDINIKRTPSSSIGLDGKALLQVTNKTGAAWYDTPVSVRLPPGLAASQDHAQTLTSLLPFQQSSVELAVRRTGLFGPTHGTIQVEVGNQTTTYEESLGSSWEVFALVGGSVFCAAIAGGVLVFHKRRYRVVRGQSKKSSE